MADISDVTAYLTGVAASAVYPNGTGSPSVANMDALIYEGWPVAEQLTLDMSGQEVYYPGASQTARPTGKRAHVSIFPLPGGHTPYQILDKTRIITPAAIDCTLSVSGDGITLTGTPAANEFLTVVLDRTYAYSSGGATAVAILSGLLTKIQVNFPSASLSGNTLTVPINYELTVRQGGVGTLGKVIHRECQSVQISVWAPDPTTRSTLAKAIDVAVKSNIVVTLSDGSDVKIVYRGTNTIDDHQNVNCYRRDLVFECEFATLFTFPGTTITSVGITINGSNSFATIAEQEAQTATEATSQI